MEIKRGMAFDHGKVVEAVEAIKEQGPGSIERIIKDEVKPFIEDVETLTTSMANLYEQHAANFIVLGVRVHITVEVIGKPAFKSQVGASLFDKLDPNIIVKKGEKDAATSI